MGEAIMVVMWFAVTSTTSVLSATYVLLASLVIVLLLA